MYFHPPPSYIMRDEEYSVDRVLPFKVNSAPLLRPLEQPLGGGNEDAVSPMPTTDVGAGGVGSGGADAGDHADTVIELTVHISEMFLFHKAFNWCVGAMCTGARCFLVVSVRHKIATVWSDLGVSQSSQPRTRRVGTRHRAPHHTTTATPPHDQHTTPPSPQESAFSPQRIQTKLVRAMNSYRGSMHFSDAPPSEHVDNAPPPPGPYSYECDEAYDSRDYSNWVECGRSDVTSPDMIHPYFNFNVSLPAGSGVCGRVC